MSFRRSLSILLNNRKITLYSDGSTFKLVVSPVDAEPFSRVRLFLAEYLSSRRDTQEKYIEIINKVRFSD